MMFQCPRHIDGYTCIILLIVTFYAIIGARWMQPERKAVEEAPSLRSRISTATSPFRRLIGGRHLNFSQWVVDPSVTKESCCQFIQSLKKPVSPLRYRYGIEYQSCCQDPYPGTPFAPLRYTGDTNFDAKGFMNAVKGKRVLFVGDSLMRQSISALICALEKDGIVPLKVDKPTQQPWGDKFKLPEDDNMDFTASFAGDTKLERVSMRKFVNVTFDAVLSYADVLIVNLGAWYRRAQRLKFQDDINQVMEGLAQFSAQPGKFAALVDTLPQHFITHRGSGDFYEKSNMTGCTSVVPERYYRSGGDWHSRITRKAAKKQGVPFVEVVDIFLPRGDAHLEFRPKSNPQGKMIQKLDCSHWCQRNSLWVPLITRFQQTLLKGNVKSKSERPSSTPTQLS